MVQSDDDSGLSPATGKVTLTGLQPGRYRVTWWDTHTGKSLDETDIRVKKEKDEATLTTPPVIRDVAFYATRLINRPEKSNLTQGQRNGGNGFPSNSINGNNTGNNTFGTGGTGGTATTPGGFGPQTTSPQTGGR